VLQQALGGVLSHLKPERYQRQAPPTIHERLDVNEHLLTASSGSDEAEASIVVPVRYLPFVSHNGSS
jgi:hypothetical protein